MYLTFNRRHDDERQQEEKEENTTTIDKELYAQKKSIKSIEK